MDFASRLLLLLDIVEMGSFAKASEHRNINRSVVSRHVNKLEEELGVRLLNRNTRSLSLTAAGYQILGKAKSLRLLLNETQLLAQNYHSEPRGTLRITSSCYFGRTCVHHAVVNFQNKYPAVKVELSLDDRVVDLVGEGYDIGFRTGVPKDSTLISKQLARTRLLIVASPDFIKRYGEPKTVMELEQLPAVIYASKGLCVDKFKYYNSEGKEAWIQLHCIYKVNELEMLVDAAKNSLVLAVVTAQMIENEVLDGKLIPVLTDTRLADYGIFYAVYPHRDAPLKTRLFLDVIKECIGDTYPVWESRIPGFDAMYGEGI